MEAPTGHVSNAFGGAALGFRRNHLEVMGRIVEFGYMGSAEYELGVVPTALSRFSIYASKNKIISFEQQVTISDHDYMTGKNVSKTVPVFVLTPRKYHKQTIAFLDASDRWRTPEPTYFRESILAADPDSYQGRTKGWFDMDNQVFFFTDRGIFEQVRLAFGVRDRTVPALAGVAAKVTVTEHGPVPVGPV